MTETATSPREQGHAPTRRRITGVLVLADGTVFEGAGLGASGKAVGEVCFNTAMTGYQEILTDPSYAAQIICFTFPHIGNVGTNLEDIETVTPAARGLIVKASITEPSNYRNAQALDIWLKRHNMVALSGIDTRRLTRLIRENGMPNGVIAHDPTGSFDIAALKKEAAKWPGLEGMDLAKDVTARQQWTLDETRWMWGQGYSAKAEPRFNVVVIDYGVKRNILRSLSSIGARLTVVPADTSYETIARLKPDGVVLSNGPGDPAATGEYAGPVIRKLVDSGLPVFGICLGHQMLALALGAKTKKMRQGHHGANHPVKDVTTGKVEIVSMNHGFTVDTTTLPRGVKETHVSLFDGSNCGLSLEGRPVFSVQYHPEASPGPHDSQYLFDRFKQAMEQKR
ncbi:MAG: glutamine-hydrolyzing carbamoyl-phosphate synthase small subunit [Alphaproteobacteria bacterium]|nr:glutamine-hydrolyzing carbamoyl-phosphate synthase small subunit [Alphaproteobacteria bacterium]